MLPLLILFNNIITLIFQCDLVPSWVLSRWLNVLKDDFPTIAFHASVNKSFGKVPSVHVDALIVLNFMAVLMK